MELSLITEKPHSEADILSNNPIVYKAGEILLSFNLQPMKMFTRFERGLKVYTAHALAGTKELEGLELDRVILESLNWWEPGFGLPWFLCQHAEIVNFEIAKPLLIKHFEQHPKLIPEIPEDYSNPIFLRFLLADYLFYNMSVDQFMDLTRDLVFLQSNIKKKAMAIQEKAPEKPPSVSTQLPHWSMSRVALESRQRKRLRLLAMSSSSPSPTKKRTKMSAS